jgi:hypothetical protein
LNPDVGFDKYNKYLLLVIDGIGVLRVTKLPVIFEAVILVVLIFKTFDIVGIVNRFDDNTLDPFILTFPVKLTSPDTSNGYSGAGLLIPILNLY